MILRDDDASDALATACRETLASAASSFDAARALARRMGGLVTGPGKAEFGFWAPELLEARVPDGDIFLEVLQPDAQFSLTVSRQNARFRRTRLPVSRVDAWVWCAVDGIRAGTRDVIGDFYALAWRDGEGEWHRIFDPLAASVPFGVFAPAELYDLAAMQAARTDKAYFEGLAPGPDGAPAKLGPAVNILQIHTPTATAGRTLASLARQIEHLADRVRHGGAIEPADRLFMGYEAVQLLPVEPTTVYEAGPAFWEDEGDYGEVLTADLRRPDTTNWGYDIVISGMAAVNPALLESGRPDELADLIAALHNFPGGPKKMIFDVVYGHSDNQGLEALNRHYFAGPNMYGQNLAYRNWTVRAIMLEMQRRKVDFGADGVRVDGAQDFKWWDADAEVMRHDDDYLQEMADVVQEVAGVKYRPWFIFEDGRPWPQEDWELSSTYRAVIDNQRDDDVFQWGPLTFAHNTPFLYTFWLSKWWRIREMVERGSNWISGTANHDTLRRGTQINPKLNINTRLGETRMDILDHAYDNPAVQMLTYAAFPGVPMDFLNAMARASWGFIRNQDDKYGVKIMAEEAISLEWQVDDYAYSFPGAFSRLKALGYETRDDLERFLHVLPALVEVTDYDLDVIASLVNAVEPPLAGPSPFTPAALKVIARAWMDDMHDYCNVAGYLNRLTERQTAFALALREFRAARPWLRQNFAWGDQFTYVQPVDGTVLFTSFRQGPDGEQVYMVAHMEGAETADFDPLNLHHQAADGQGGWRVALATPQIGDDYQGGPIVLRDSMGVVFTRPAPG
ncbi:MAG: glucosylglycerol hydrolase [Pseudomonadota bacterium]|nr:glucosylglycerol hydrolase [Pseudomonadota bacterium]